MANDANKKLLKANSETLSKYRYILLAVNAIYLLWRAYYLYESLSKYHAAGVLLTCSVNAGCYLFLSFSASPKYAPGGALVSAGTDLSQPGVIEYTWDILYVTMFVQLTTAFFSDWFWLIYLIPPGIGFYYLWTMVIYPYISRPDAPAAPGPMDAPKQKVKYGKGR